MAGKEAAWEQIARSFGTPHTKASLRRQLNEIVNRRNQIVHEGDYVQLDRPRGPDRNKITASYANEAILFIERLIDAIHRMP